MGPIFTGGAVSCHDKRMTSSTSTDAFRAARDLLLAHREDYDAARRSFAWPELDEFNWALDWFDVIAAEHPARIALRILSDDSDVSLSYASLSARSSQVAGWLRGLGVRRGDRVLLMLGNVVPLWEVILATMKLGAVIIPASTLLQPADLVDRVARGQVRHVITDTACAPRFSDVPGEWTRIAVGGDVSGWASYQDAFASAAADFVPEGVTRASDPLLLYFTSGTTALPKLVAHTQVSYPAGHLSTMYWVGIQPGDVHLNLSSPGWAKHAWSNVFAPWNAGATVLVLNYARFSAASLLAAFGSCGVSTFCAPPTVWRMLIQADLGAADVSALRECVAAGEPLNPEVIERVRQAWGITVRDGFGQTETTAQVGNTPGQPVRVGSMGRPLPGYAVVLIDPVSGQPGRDGEICLDLSRRPLGLMTGYLDDPSLNARAMARRVLPHRRRGHVGRGRLHHVRGPHGRRLQGLGLPDLAVRAGERADRARGGGRGGRGAGAGPGAAGRAEGVRAAGRGAFGVAGAGAVDHGVLPGAGRAVQADPAGGVRRPAEDDLGQDPAGRAARPGDVASGFAAGDDRVLGRGLQLVGVRARGWSLGLGAPDSKECAVLQDLFSRTAHSLAFGAVTVGC